MNPKIWQILQLVAGGASQLLLPPPLANLAQGIIGGVGDLESRLAAEERLKGVPDDKLFDDLLTALEQSVAAHHSEMEERRRRIAEG